MEARCLPERRALYNFLVNKLVEELKLYCCLQGPRHRCRDQICTDPL